MCEAGRVIHHLKAAIEDEKNFIDHSRVASFITVEKPVVEPA